VRYLDRENYGVDLASGSGGDWEHKAREVADSFIPLEHLVRSLKRPFADFKTLLDLVGLMRRRNYDIVHTHSAKAGLLGRVAAKIVGIPIIIHTLHGFHGFTFFDRALFVIEEKLGALLSDKIITVSEINREDAISLGIFPASKAVTIYSGIDVTKFCKTEIEVKRKKTELGLPPSAPVVGTVGRLAEQKAPLDFVAAARIVLDENPQTRFIMVGDGPLYDDVSASIGEESRIKMLGYRSDVDELLQIMDVFAISSLWEGVGRSLTEALAAKRPVVATEVAGVPELVMDGQTGLLVPPQDPQALAEKIQYLLENREQAVGMAKRGQKKVFQLFDVRDMVDDISFLYQELLREKGLVPVA
jgi:glycosyltransferase involved in cell wall biosynthesis